MEHPTHTHEELSRFRVAMDMSGDAIYLVDRTAMRFVDVNQTACTRMGYSREELLRMGPQDLLTISRKDIERLYDEVIAGGANGTTVQSLARTKDGRESITELQRCALRIDGNWLIVSIARDITQRKRTERDLVESEQRFRSLLEEQKTQNLRFDVAIDNMSQGLCFFEGNQRLIVCNRVYAEMYKLTQDLIRPGTTLSEIVDYRFAVGCFPDMSRTEYLHWRDSIVISAKPSHTVVKLKDGRTIAIHHQPMPDGGWVATHEDITGREAAVEEIRRLNADLEGRVARRTASLEASSRELESLAYTMSHDLRTPLRAINAYTQLLAAGAHGEFEQKAQDYLKRIGHNSGFMSKLVDGMLEFMRVSRVPIERENINFSKMVQSIADAQKVSGREIQFNISQFSPCRADPKLLSKVFEGLISNAVKFTRTRALAQIDIGESMSGGERSYYVNDNGVGFEMAYVNKLFGMFQRLHVDTEFEGTGVNLAIVQRIIARHGGRIWAEGEVGKGARFSFRLPN
jgi:PAS domain S-box-containing protein